MFSVYFVFKMRNKFTESGNLNCLCNHFIVNTCETCAWTQIKLFWIFFWIVLLLVICFLDYSFIRIRFSIQVELMCCFLSFFVTFYRRSLHVISSEKCHHVYKYWHRCDKITYKLKQKFQHHAFYCSSKKFNEQFIMYEHAKIQNWLIWYDRLTYIV